jgi:sugar/nucleoside kinase (ribokinase family)
MIDRQGDDWTGREIRAELESHGVCTRYCLAQSGASSALASIWVREADGARSIAYSPSTAAPVSSADLPEGVIESARILHSNGRHEGAWFEAARRAREAGVAVSFDGGAHRFRPEMRNFLPWIDLAIVSLDWAERCTGKANPSDASQALAELGPELVVVTAGRGGSWIQSGRVVFHQPAFCLPETIDTTGCGDVYHGAFLTGWAWDWPLHRCAQVASAAAAMNSCALGGRGALPTLAEVEAFLERFDLAKPGNAPRDSA